MIKKSVFLFILCASPLLPTFTRFSYGLIFAVAFCISFLGLLGARKLIFLCKLKNDYTFILEALFLLLCVALYLALVRLALPLDALSLDFFLYAVPFVYLLFEALSTKYNECADGQLVVALTAALFPPAASLLRELLYFGTITFPAIGEARCIEALPADALEFTRFFGSLPGFLILLGLLLWLWNIIPAGENDSDSSNESSNSGNGGLF